MAKKKPVPKVSPGAFVAQEFLAQVARRRKSRPTCFHCRKGKAKSLSGIGYYNRCKIFCSHHCASIFAVRMVAKSLADWCQVHGQWTDHNGDCPACELAGMTPDDMVTLPPDVLDATKTGGPHA